MSSFPILFSRSLTQNSLSNKKALKTFHFLLFSLMEMKSCQKTFMMMKCSSSMNPLSNTLSISDISIPIGVVINHSAYWIRCPGYRRDSLPLQPVLSWKTQGHKHVFILNATKMVSVPTICFILLWILWIHRAFLNYLCHDLTLSGMSCFLK